MRQQTLAIIKPDAVSKNLVGKIIERIEAEGIKIVAMKMIKMSKEQAKGFYHVHKGKPFYQGLIDYLTEGPVVAMVIEGANAIENVRKIVGSTEPKKSLPGTIRGDFAHISYERADSVGKPLKNLIHASDSPESAEREIKLWFKEEEIHSYKLPYEEHVF